MDMGALTEDHSMKLVSNWKRLVRKAWSMRAMAAAALCGVAEIVLPIYFTALPKGIFSILSLLAIFGGMYFRVVVQKDMEDDNK
jgi:hypothetical protein